MHSDKTGCKASIRDPTGEAGDEGRGVTKEDGTARIGTKGKLKHSREWEGKATEEKELKEVCVAQRSKYLARLNDGD